MEPGWIGMATGKLGRHRAFDVSLNRLITPAGSDKGWEPSENISFNYNNMVRKMLGDERYRWLWILGDDHAFAPDFLMRLLERDVDIVVPLCVRRSLPFYPILLEGKAGGYEAAKDFSWLAGKTGIVRLTDKVTGNAGMLVRRHVLEAMSSPWFEDGKTLRDKGGCDVWFCQKAIDAGFELYLDLDNPIEHVTHVAAWPELDKNGMYNPVLHKASEHLKARKQIVTT
jgi:hypothetical protein